MNGKLYETDFRSVMLYGLELEVADMLRFSLTSIDRIEKECIRTTCIGWITDTLRKARGRWYGHVQPSGMTPGEKEAKRPKRVYIDENDT